MCPEQEYLVDRLSALHTEMPKEIPNAFGRYFCLSQFFSDPASPVQPVSDQLLDTEFMMIAVVSLTEPVQGIRDRYERQSPSLYEPASQ